MRRQNQQGFTLIEMLMVIAIIGILLSLAIPSYIQSMQRAREAALRENLYNLRSLIEEYTLDKQHPPGSLQDLVQAGYLRELPKDITGSRDSWQAESCTLDISPEQTSAGICDVRSSSTGVASDGSSYNSW